MKKFECTLKNIRDVVNFVTQAEKCSGHIDLRDNTQPDIKPNGKSLIGVLTVYHNSPFTVIVEKDDDVKLLKDFITEV